MNYPSNHFILSFMIWFKIKSTTNSSSEKFSSFVLPIQDVHPDHRKRYDLNGRKRLNRRIIALFFTVFHCITPFWAVFLDLGRQQTWYHKSCNPQRSLSNGWYEYQSLHRKSKSSKLSILSKSFYLFHKLLLFYDHHFSPILKMFRSGRI